VQEVGLVQAWQFAITVEQVTQAPEEELRYWVEVQAVHVAPLDPLAQRTQYDEFVHELQLGMAELQGKH
jgi:hypothetical protein